MQMHERKNLMKFAFHVSVKHDDQFLHFVSSCLNRNLLLYYESIKSFNFRIKFIQDSGIFLLFFISIFGKEFILTASFVVLSFAV